MATWRSAKLPTIPNQNTNIRFSTSNEVNQIQLNFNNHMIAKDAEQGLGTDLSVATTNVLESLSGKERQMILEVLKRDEGVRQRDAARIMLLRTELHYLRNKGAIKTPGPLDCSQSIESNRCCARCNIELGHIINRGAPCKVCKLRVCKACREFTSHTTDWVCIVCHKQMEFHATSDEWENEFTNNQNKKSSTKEFISTANILKQSIRRSWIISNTENEKQNHLNNYQNSDQKTNNNLGPKCREVSTGSHPTLTRYSVVEPLQQSASSAQQVHQSTHNMDYNDKNCNQHTSSQRRVLRQSTLPTTISTNLNGFAGYYYQTQKNLTAPTSPKCQISPQHSISYSSENVIINKIRPECEIQPPSKVGEIGVVSTIPSPQSQLQTESSPEQIQNSSRLTVRRQSTLPCLPTESSPYIYMSSTPNHLSYSRSPERSEAYPPLFRQSTLPSNLCIEAPGPQPYVHRQKLLPTSPNRLTTNYIPQLQQSDENLISCVDYNMHTQKTRVTRQVTLPNPDQHVKLLPTSPPKRQLSPSYLRRSPEFVKQNTLPNPDQFNSLSVQQLNAKFSPISPRQKQNFLFPTPSLNCRTFLSQQNVPTVAETDQYTSSHSVNVHNPNAKMIKVRSHSNEEYTITRVYPTEGRRLLPEIPKSPRSLNRLVRQDHVKEDITQQQLPDRNSVGRRTFAEAKQNLPEYVEDRSQQEYSDYFSDNSLLEVDEPHYENNCSTGYNSEPKIIYNDSTQEVDAGSEIVAISSENFVNGQDYHLTEDNCNYKAFRREQILQHNRQRRRRSRETLETTEVMAAENEIITSNNRRKPETMRSISEDSGAKPIIKPVTRRSLSHPEKESQNGKTIEQTKIPSPKPLVDLFDKGKKTSKLPVLPKQRSSKVDEYNQFCAEYISNDVPSPLKQQQFVKDDSNDSTFCGRHNKNFSCKSPDKNALISNTDNLTLSNQLKNAKSDITTVVNSKTTNSETADDKKETYDQKIYIQKSNKGYNEKKNVEEIKGENDNKPVLGGSDDEARGHKPTLGEAEIQSAVEAAAVIFKKVVLQRRQEKKAAEEGDFTKRYIIAPQKDDVITGQETSSSIFGMKMYYPEGNEYKIVFISSDSSSKEEDFEETSSTTSSTKNCSSTILDECDWDYFESGALGFTEPTFQSSMDSLSFCRRGKFFAFSESSTPSKSREQMRQGAIGTDKEILMPFKNSIGTSSDDSNYKNNLLMKNRIKTKYFRHNNYLSGHSLSSSISLSKSRRANENSLPCSCGANRTTGVSILPQYVPIPVPVAIPIPISDCKNLNSNDLILSRNLENEMYNALQYLWKNPNTNLVQKQIQEQAVNVLQLQQHQLNNYNSIKIKSPTQLKPNEPQYKSNEISNIHTKSLAETIKETKNKRDKENKSFLPVLYRTTNKEKKLSLAKSSPTPVLFTDSFKNKNGFYNFDGFSTLHLNKKLENKETTNALKNKHLYLSTSIMSVCSSSTSSTSIPSFSLPIFSSTNLNTKETPSVLMSHNDDICLDSNSSLDFTTQTTISSTSTTFASNITEFSSSYSNKTNSVQNEPRTCTTEEYTPNTEINKHFCSSNNLLQISQKNSFYKNRNKFLPIRDYNNDKNILFFADNNINTNKNSSRKYKFNNNLKTTTNSYTKNSRNVLVTDENKKKITDKQGKIWEFQLKNSIAKRKPYKRDNYNNNNSSNKFNIKKNKSKKYSTCNNNTEKFSKNSKNNIKNLCLKKNKKNEDVETPIVSHSFCKIHNNTNNNNNLDINVRPLATDKKTIIKQLITSRNKQKKEILREKFKQKTKVGMITIGKSLKPSSHQTVNENECSDGGYLISENMFSSSSESETSIDYQNKFCNDYDNKNFIKISTDLRKKSIKQSYDVASASGINKLIILNEDLSLTLKKNEDISHDNIPKLKYITPCKDNSVSSSSSESEDTDDTDTIAERRPKSSKFFSKVFVVNQINNTLTDSDTLSSDASLENSCENDSDIETECGIILNYVKSLSQENLQNISENDSDSSSIKNISNKKIDLIRNCNYNFDNFKNYDYIKGVYQNDIEMAAACSNEILVNNENHGIVLNSIRKLSFDNEYHINQVPKNCSNFNSVKNPLDNNTIKFNSVVDKIGYNETVRSDNSIKLINLNQSKDKEKCEKLNNIEKNENFSKMFEDIKLNIKNNNLNSKEMNNYQKLDEKSFVCEKDNLEELNSITSDVDKLLKYNSEETEYLVEKLKKNVKEINEDLLLKPTTITSEESDSNSSTSNSDKSILTSTFAKFTNISLTLSNDEDEINIPLIDLNLKKNENKVSKPVTFKNKKTKSISNSKIRGKVIIEKEKNKTFLQKLQPSHKLQQSIFSSQSLSSLFPSFSFESKQENQKIVVPKTGLLEQQYKKQHQAVGLLLLNKTQNIVDINSSNTKGNIIQPLPTNVNYKYIKNMLDDPADQKRYFERSENIISQIEAIDLNKNITKNKAYTLDQNKKTQPTKTRVCSLNDEVLNKNDIVKQDFKEQQKQEKNYSSRKITNLELNEHNQILKFLHSNQDFETLNMTQVNKLQTNITLFKQPTSKTKVPEIENTTTDNIKNDTNIIQKATAQITTPNKTNISYNTTNTTAMLKFKIPDMTTTSTEEVGNKSAVLSFNHENGSRNDKTTTMLNKNEIIKTTNTFYYSGNESCNNQITNNNENVNSTKYLTHHHQSNNNTEKFNVLNIGDTHIQTSNYKSNMNEKTNIPSDSIKQQQFSKGNTHTNLNHTFQIDNYLQKNIQTTVEYDHSYVSGESISVESQFTINNNLLFSSINKNESINNAKSLSSKYRSLVIINQDRSKNISGTSNSEIQIMEKELLKTPKIHIIHDTQSAAHFEVKDNDKINKSQITIRNNKSPNHSNEISINFNHKNQNNEQQNSSKKNSSSSNNNSDLNKMSNSAMMTSLYLNKKLNKNIHEKNKSLDSVTQKDNSEELLKSEFNLKKSLVEQQPVNHIPIQNNSKDISTSFIFSTSNNICDSNDVTVITGPTTLTAAVCLEDGLADDDSWVEEISQDEEEITGASTTATDSDIDSSEDILLSHLIDREEELRGYNRTAIDFTLHTIIEESCEEWSEVEQTNSSNRSSRSYSGKKSKTPGKQKVQQGSPSELEKYFVFGLGDGNIMTSIDTKEESSSEVSSICSEGLDSLIEPPINTNIDETNNAAQLACSRLEKYFLSGFMGYCQSERNESDESGSVGSDSEGKPSPSQRRKRLVRARGTPRSQNSSLDNLLAKDIENNDFSQCENQNDSHDSSESENCDNTVIHIEKGEHDTIKRKKQARKRHDSDEGTRKSIENEEQFSDKNNDTLQQDFLISNCGSNLVQSKSQHSRDSGFVGSNDDLLKNDEWIRSPEIKLELEDIKEETKETDSSNFFRNLQHPNTLNKPPTHPQSLTRKDSFNNWSSDEDTNLMMSKMRQFFKTLVAANANASSSKNSTPIVSATSTPKNLTPVARIKNRNKPAQLAYFESELTRLMKTVPGINDDQVREIVEYLSSEDTWSDSYDSSDYTSSDLEGVVNKKKNLVLKEQISASCQQIINKFDNPVNDREGDLGDGGLIEETHNSYSESALVYQKLVQSFSKITTGDENTKFLQENNNESTSSNQSNQRLINVDQSDKSPKLLATVMHHIGTKLVALMHEVSSGDSRASNSPAPPQRYHKRINQKLLKKGDNDEDDDSLSDCSNDKINEFKHHTVQVQINNAKIPITQTTTSISISTTDADAVALILPRSKSHDLLLNDARPQHHQSSSGVSDIAAEENVASDYERFSWRGSFESALLANGDSRTKLTLLDRDNSSSASALIAKRRSAGDLLFNQTRLSQEQLDRVRSCGSIDGSTVNDENELQTTKSWNTSINHHHNVNSNNNIEEHNILPNRRRSSVPDSICEYEGTSDEDNNSGDGSVNKTRSTLPRSLQNFQTSASNTNSLPRLPTTPLMPTASITKAQSVLHFLPNNIKSARYRPPGVNSNTRNNSITKKASSTSGLSQLLYSRRDGRRKFNIFGPNEEAAAAKSSGDISNSSIIVSKNVYSVCNNPISTPGSASSDPWPSQSDEDIDRLVALHQNRNSLSSLGKRSDSMASVYSGAGDGRYGTVIVKGQIEFGMQYNYKQSALEIHVVRCKDLAAIDSKRNRSDPYVKVYLLPDKSKGGKRKTKVKKHTLNPVFDEVLRFHMPMSNLESRQLWLTVWHSDMFGRNDFLGEVIIDLAGRLFDKPHPQWYLLQERSEPFDDISVYRGDIIVGLKFVPPENATSKNSLTRGSNSNLKKFGSIKGNSKNFSTKGQLHVLVKEAKNLTAIKPNGVCDAFCKSYLLPDRTRGSKQKTQIAKRTNNPVWNYTFVYEDVSLQELSERALELTIWDHDRLASNEFLGGVRFSLGTGKHYGKLLDWMDATGKELFLWQNMLNRPNFWVEGALILRSSLDGIKALP